MILIVSGNKNSTYLTFVPVNKNFWVQLCKSSSYHDKQQTNNKKTLVHIRALHKQWLSLTRPFVCTCACCCFLTRQH